MSRVNRYLLSNFWATLSPLFLVLFFIMSVIFFIQIARITSIIEINFYELGKLYIYSLPQILLYTFSISFFIALTLTLFRLSKENEIIVLFSLGYSPKKVAQFFTYISAITTVVLLFNALVLMPLASQLNRNFISYKKTNANFTLKPAEFGQKFSNWLVFVEGESDDGDAKEYQDIVMFTNGTDGTNERFIIAKSATIDNDGGDMALELGEGFGYDISSTRINETEFEKLIMKSYSSENASDVVGVFEYWSDLFTRKGKASTFALDTLVALIPICTTLFTLAFGIVTYRYQRKGIYFEIFLVFVLYFGTMSLTNKTFPLPSILIISLSSILLSTYFFWRNILKRY